jgi:drug/metabolite transporter (DMT)-like permease
MSPIAIALIITSTFTHAFWNLIGKRRSPSAAFFLLASLVMTLAVAPLILYHHRVLPIVPGIVWALLIATGACQALYYISLAGAYRYGQLSVAYPLARSLPAMLVALVTTLLGLGETINLTGVVGIVLVVIGCLYIPLGSFRNVHLDSYLNPCCGLALLAACGTTGYTIIDSEALARLRALPGLDMSAAALALFFMELEFVTTCIWLSIYVLWRSGERKTFIGLWQNGLGSAAVTGLMIGGTYGLVLIAMGFVTNVSYLAAFRELSIPLGALLGITFQKEPAPLPKIFGIGVVLIGLLLVGLA